MVTPVLNNIPTMGGDDPNDRSVREITIDPGQKNDPLIIRGWDFEAATADALLKATTLEAQVSIIRAGAGSGLE